MLADAPVQHGLEDKMTALGMRTQDELDNATRAQYMQQLPGVTHLPKENAVADPRLLGALKDATTELRARQSDLQDALSQKVADTQTHNSRVGSYITSTIKRLPVSYENDRMLDRTFRRLSKMVRESRPVTAADNKAAIKAARENVADAKKTWRGALRDVKSKKLYGTLIHDPAVPAVTKAGSKVFGLHLRPVTDEDYAEALSHEPAGFSPAHVTSRNFFRHQIQDMRSAAADNTPKLAEAGQSALTGEA